MNTDILQSTPTRAASTLTAPAFTMPQGACDSHVHVFGPEARYPRVAHPHYTLPDGSAEQLDAMTRELGIERFAIVQPSFYGTDNRCMLDALDRIDRSQQLGEAGGAAVNTQIAPVGVDVLAKQCDLTHSVRGHRLHLRYQLSQGPTDLAPAR